MTEEDQLLYLPETDILKHTGIVWHIKNHWWSFHPERGLIFFPRYSKSKFKHLENSTPQCNLSRDITERLQKQLYSFAMVKFFESVLVPVDIRDYFN